MGSAEALSAPYLKEHVASRFMMRPWSRLKRGGRLYGILSDSVFCASYSVPPLFCCHFMAFNEPGAVTTTLYPPDMISPSLCQKSEVKMVCA